MTLRHYKTGLDELFVARWFRSKRIEARQMTSVLLLTPGSVCPKCARDVADAPFSGDGSFVCPGCRTAAGGTGRVHVNDEDFPIMLAGVPVQGKSAFVNAHNAREPYFVRLRLVYYEGGKFRAELPVLLLPLGSVCPKCACDVADATFSCQRKFVCPGCCAAGRGGKHDGILYVKDEDFSIMFANVPVWRQLAFINEHNILAPTVRLLRQNLG